MLYAILCYDSEDAVASWSAEKEGEVMARLGEVQDRLRAQGRLGPVARLLPTSAATTVRKGAEQLLGFYVVECETLDEAIAVAKDLGRASGSAGAHEVRPLQVFRPGELHP